MANKLDFVTIIDLESTCWQDKPPEGQVSEIIEIGIALVAVNDWSLVESESILVKPVDSEVSEFCTELTTLTQEQLDEQGIPFLDALGKLRHDYKVKDRTWASYGDYDRRMFQRQCSWWNVPYPFGPSHINVKNLFALQQKLTREVGMAEALKMIGEKLDGTHHRGVDDACNIAKLLRYVMT